MAYSASLCLCARPKSFCLGWPPRGRIPRPSLRQAQSLSGTVRRNRLDNGGLTEVGAIHLETGEQTVDGRAGSAKDCNRPLAPWGRAERTARHHVQESAPQVRFFCPSAILKWSHAVSLRG